MQLEGLTIALRARSPWEATDLGIALVRTHARRIYSIWMLVTLPLFVLLNAAAWAMGHLWIAVLAMWWLKPMFDRIPLFVLSRAVFGESPTLRATFDAQRHWGWRAIIPWLLWRRLHPGRAMLLPVDLLEGSTGAQRSVRVRVLARANGSPNVMLTILGMHFELMLYFSTILVGLMFVPIEFMSDSAKAVWQTLFDSPPLWAQALANFNVWIAMTVIELFYVGAGFGLYLNRRMQLEGWDIELKFRRIAARLAQPTLAVILFGVVALGFSPSSIATAPWMTVSDSRKPALAVPAPTRASNELAADEDDDLPDDESGAQDKLHEKKKPKDEVTTLQKLFTDDYRSDGADFDASVKKAYQQADLSPTTRGFVWRRRHPVEDDPKEATPRPWWLKALGQSMGFIFQFGLWIVLAIVLILIVINHRHWLPWISDRFVRERDRDHIEVHDIAAPDALPDDVVSAVRGLLAKGRTRAALALLYRASVVRLADMLGTPLPPGATESECLRQARRLAEPSYAALFPRIVRCWQTAAYAQRLPQTSEVEALLDAWNAPAQVSA